MGFAAHHHRVSGPTDILGCGSRRLWMEDRGCGRCDVHNPQDALSPTARTHGQL